MMLKLFDNEDNFNNADYVNFVIWIQQEGLLEKYCKFKPVE